MTFEVSGESSELSLLFGKHSIFNNFEGFIDEMDVLLVFLV